MGNKNKGKRITWNGSAVVHGAGGSWWRWCCGSRLGWQTLVLFLLFFALACCLLPLFFVSPINSVLASLQWLCGGVVGASGVAGGGEEEDWRWYAEDAASVSLYFLFLPPAFCRASLCFLSFSSVLRSLSSLSFSLSFSFFSSSPLFPSLSLFLLCSTLLSLPPFFFWSGDPKIDNKI